MASQCIKLVLGQAGLPKNTAQRADSNLTVSGNDGRPDAGVHLLPKLHMAPALTRFRESRRFKLPSDFAVR